MNRGFITIAQNGECDYVRMAYALAMSLKLSQRKYNKLTVVVNQNEEIPEKYLKVFDKVIYTTKPIEQWKIQNKWRYFWYSPYDETIALDTDMLFFHDISDWWDMHYDINFTTSVKNYRGNTVDSDYYREVFTKNNLPNLYTALFHFRKTKEVYNYFILLKEIFENWEVFYEKFLKNPPKFLSGDVAYALAAKVMTNRKWGSHLTFTHMRSRLQDAKMVDDWNKYLPSFFTKYDGQVGLKVNNFNQLYPFHYLKENFLNDEVIELYENSLRLF